MTPFTLVSLRFWLFKDASKLIFHVRLTDQTPGQAKTYVGGS